MTDSGSPTPNKRGAGECFGPETTNKFLQRHNLTTLVRSHECKHEGYEIVHNGNVSWKLSKKKLRNNKSKTTNR